MASSAAKGGARVGATMTTLATAGYRCARVSASGQRKGSRKQERGIAGDVLALAPAASGLPHLAIEVGGIGKRLQAAFGELTREPLPGGFAPLVVRFVGRRRWYYTAPDLRFASISLTLQALREDS